MMGKEGACKAAEAAERESMPAAEAAGRERGHASSRDCIGGGKRESMPAARLQRGRESEMHA